MSHNWVTEARALLRLAGPLIVNNLSIAGMQFADAVMAGRLGASSLAAVAVGGSVWFLGFTVCLGLMMAISPIAARYFGAGQPELIGRYTRQGLWLAVVLSLSIFTFVQLFIEPVLSFVGIDIGFRETTVSYVRAIVFGAPAICVFLAFRFTTEGIGFTRPIMYTSLFALVCNVFLNWVLMYGKFGVPAYGAVGCGMASATTMWLMTVMMVIYFARKPIYRPLKIFERMAPLRLPVLKEILNLGTPIAITIAAEAGLFSVVSILVGTRGADITAAHQIALNFAATMFMIPLALSAATTVRIGQALGKGSPYGARLGGLTGIVMCGAFHGLLGDVSAALQRPGRRHLYERSVGNGDSDQSSADGGSISSCRWCANRVGWRSSWLQRHAAADAHQHFFLLGAWISARVSRGDYLSGTAGIHLGRIRTGSIGCRNNADVPIQSIVETTACSKLIQVSPWPKVGASPDRYSSSSGEFFRFSIVFLCGNRPNRLTISACSSANCAIVSKVSLYVADTAPASLLYIWHDFSCTLRDSECCSGI